MIVVDASVLVDFLRDRPSAVRMIAEAIAEDGSEVLHAPEILQLEALQSLRLLNRAGKASDDEVQAAVEALAEAQVAHHSSLPFSSRIWELRHNLTAYDASYLALAETLEDPLLLTGDTGLAEQARGSLGSERVRLLRAGD